MRRQIYEKQGRLIRLENDEKSSCEVRLQLHSPIRRWLKEYSDDRLASVLGDRRIHAKKQIERTADGNARSKRLGHSDNSPYYYSAYSASTTKERSSHPFAEKGDGIKAISKPRTRYNSASTLAFAHHCAPGSSLFAVGQSGSFVQQFCSTRRSSLSPFSHNRFNAIPRYPIENMKNDAYEASTLTRHSADYTFLTSFSFCNQFPLENRKFGRIELNRTIQLFYFKKGSFCLSVTRLCRV